MKTLSKRGENGKFVIPDLLKTDLNVKKVR